MPNNDPDFEDHIGRLFVGFAMMILANLLIVVVYLAAGGILELLNQ